MTVLAYCVTRLEEPVVPAGAGVSQATVEQFDCDGLRVYFSELPPQAVPGDARRQPLEFQAVVERVFDRAPVAPFRFPTLAESREALRELLRPRATQLREGLERLGDAVQMELRVTADMAESPQPSGRDYLISRQRAVSAMQQAVTTLETWVAAQASAWRVRQGYTNVRCYALVPRNAIAAFTERTRDFEPPEGVHILCSGPWPPSEFIPAEAS